MLHLVGQLLIYTEFMFILIPLVIILSVFMRNEEVLFLIRRHSVEKFNNNKQNSINTGSDFTERC